MSAMQLAHPAASSKKRSGGGNETAAARPGFIQTMTYNTLMILVLNHFAWPVVCLVCVCVDG